MGKQGIDLDEALARTRRRTSKRLMKALQDGRLHDELKAMERKSKSFYSEPSNGKKHLSGSRNGKPRAK